MDNNKKVNSVDFEAVGGRRPPVGNYSYIFAWMNRDDKQI